MSSGEKVKDLKEVHCEEILYLGIRDLMIGLSLILIKRILENTKVGFKKHSVKIFNE